MSKIRDVFPLERGKSYLNLPPSNCPKPEPTGDLELDARAMGLYVDCRLREGMQVLAERYAEATDRLIMEGYPHDPDNPKTRAEIEEELEAAVRKGERFPPLRSGILRSSIVKLSRP